MVVRIWKRYVVVKTASASVSEEELEGKALTCNDPCEIVTGSLGVGHSVVVTCLGSQKGVGTTENTIDKESFKIVDINGVDVTKNYDYSIKLGTLEVY